MNKSDLKTVFVIGILIAVLAQPILTNILPSATLRLHAALFAVIVVFAPFALYVAHLLGRVWPVLYQFAKFAAVGTLNSFMGAGALNFLSLVSGATSGIQITVFAAIAFLAATTNSFFWNKYWTFGSRGGPNSGETVKFYVVAAVGLAINTGTISFVVNYMRPQDFLPGLWLNVGTLAGVATSFLWDFLGYKYLVFRKPAKVV